MRPLYKDNEKEVIEYYITTTNLPFYVIGVAASQPYGHPDDHKQYIHPADQQYIQSADQPQYNQSTDNQYSPPADQLHNKTADKQYTQSADQQYGHPADQQDVPYAQVRKKERTSVYV